MLRVPAFGLMLVATVVATNAGESGLLEKCTELMSDPAFDCPCAAKYLEPEYDLLESEILFKAWALSRNGARAPSADFERFRAQYDAAATFRVIEKFHVLRLKVFTLCPDTRSEGHEN
jgi:hypothetical protein